MIYSYEFFDEKLVSHAIMIIKVQKNNIYIPSSECLIISIVLIDQAYLNLSQLVENLKKNIFI